MSQDLVNDSNGEPKKLNGRRKAEDFLPTLDKIVSICSTCDDRTSFTIAFLYLSGRRISEILALKREDVSIESNVLSFYCIMLKDWTASKSIKNNIEIFRPFQIKNRIAGATYYYYHKEKIFFNLNSSSGLIFKPIVLNYLETLKPGDYLFHHLHNNEEPLTRTMIYKLLRKADNDLWCHLLRHRRFTDFAIKLEGDVLLVNEFTKHKRLESDREYIHREETKKAILSV